MDVLPSITFGKELKPVKLDIKDKKILFLLANNFRRTTKSIATKVGLSIDSVKYRLENLTRDNVLKGSRMVVDVKKLGYEAYHVFIRLKDPQKEIESEFIKSVSSLPFVRALLKFYGSFDFEIAIIAKTNEELDENITSILNYVGSHIDDYQIFTLTKSIYGSSFPKSFLEGIDIKEEIKKKENSPYKPDSTDLKILKIYRDDASQPIIDVASKLKISHDSVSYRLKKMQGNILLGSLPVINYDALSHKVYAILLNIGPLTQEDEKKVMDLFQRNKNILWAVKMIGQYNFLAYVCVDSTFKLQETIEEIRTKFQGKVNKFDSLLGCAEYKYTYAPDCLFSNS